MGEWLRRILGRWWWAILLLALSGTVWLLPISRQVILTPGDSASLWPQMRLKPALPRPGEQAVLWVTDATPWVHVLLTVDGQTLHATHWEENPGGTWTWEFRFTAPETAGYALVFYHDCDTGCVEQGRAVVSAESQPAPSILMPTKLGTVFANPQRDWHGRSGWDVELTYSRLADEEYWGIDDLAARVHRATGQGLRVLVRVDYDQGQSLPPDGDEVALTGYLQYLQRLARDQRLQDVYAYFLGSSFNSLNSNTQAADRPVTPEWYARVFNGYGQEATHTDNAVQVMRAEDSRVRVLVGPVQPWNTDQDGERRYQIDVPWLNYINTLVAALDAATRAKARNGIPLTAPDGFAVQAPGRPEAPELTGREESEEPRVDLRREAWEGAQAGFRVYRDWLDVINAHPGTLGLPIYITSANTFTPDHGIPPAQNYPQGWLTTALEAIDQEPQVKALCWFLDYFPHDTQWEYFSLTRHPGRMLDAAEEFDELLQQ